MVRHCATCRVLFLWTLWSSTSTGSERPQGLYAHDDLGMDSEAINAEAMDPPPMAALQVSASESESVESDPENDSDDEDESEDNESQETESEDAPEILETDAESDPEPEVLADAQLPPGGPTGDDVLDRKWQEDLNRGDSQTAQIAPAVPRGAEMSHIEADMTGTEANNRYSHFQELLKFKPVVDKAVDIYSNDLANHRIVANVIATKQENAANQVAELGAMLKQIQNVEVAAETQSDEETRELETDSVSDLDTYSEQGVYGEDSQGGRSEGSEAPLSPDAGKWTIFKNLLEEHGNGRQPDH